jgi:hypothetical protein
MTPLQAMRHSREQFIEYDQLVSEMRKAKSEDLQLVSGLRNMAYEFWVKSVEAYGKPK